jgi:hypothetical protein
MNPRAKRSKQKRIKNDRLRDRPKAAPLPFVGYMRLSKVDGSQTLDLQQEARDAAGVPGGTSTATPPEEKRMIVRDGSRA